MTPFEISLIIEAVFLFWWANGLAVMARMSEDRGSRVIANLLSLLAITLAVIAMVSI